MNTPNGSKMSKKKQSESSETAGEQAKPAADFPRKSDNNELVVVGVGASAGGLEALQEFFSNMPEDSELAFVVIQHLSPDYKSLMDELLARHTRIPIHIAQDGMQVKPNNIYLIPPRKNISIFHDHLYLDLQNQKKSLNLPVDIFFRSLAVEKQKNAIGIILSGTGSDGTLGTRAIKEVGGMVMVQDEKSAKFDGMPRNSIATGLVDFILEPAKMPEALINYCKHPFTKSNQKTENILTQNIGALQKVALILREHCGIDFSYYKDNTIVRRLERRVSINRFDNLDDYLVFLNESYKEKEILFKELLIGVTGFFRDTPAFNSLRDNVLAQIDFSRKKLLRIWSTGCSTGEEVYSVAILCMDYFEKNNIDCELKIFATDVDRAALEQASNGFYPDSIVTDLDPELLLKYFHRKESGFQINENVRKTIVFASHNLLKDPPFSKLDLLVCRNLFIYIKPEMQHKVLASFFYSLSPGGYLFLGSSETLGSMSEAYDTIDTKWKIYQARREYRPPIFQPIDRPAYLAKDPFAAQKSLKHNGEIFKMDKVTEKLLELLAPASVIVDGNDNIVHIINNINRFISFKSGRFSNNLFNNLNPDFVVVITTMLHRLRKRDAGIVLCEELADVPGFEEKNVLIEGRLMEIANATYAVISFSIKEQAEKTESGNNGKVTQDDPDQPHAGRRHHSANKDNYLELQNELKQVKENLQATVEELETSNEELQSSNEELIASNEELQSTNEELQSVNEELFTVNYEYQSKIDELTKINNDINNLLKNTEIGALYLDTKLCIRKLTPLVAEITHILPTDIGRPISHISVMNIYPDMFEDINFVAETLQPRDREINAADNRVFLVRTRPYRTQNNAIEGILLTFVEISRVKEEQARYRNVADKLKRALALGQMACWDWVPETDKLTFDPLFAEMLGYNPAAFPGTLAGLTAMLHPRDLAAFMAEKEKLLANPSAHWDEVFRLKHKNGQFVWLRLSAGFRQDPGSRQKPQRVDGVISNISGLQKIRKTDQLRRIALGGYLDAIADPALLIGSDFEIVQHNQAFAAITAGAALPDLDHPDWQFEVTEKSTGNIPVRTFLKYLAENNEPVHVKVSCSGKLLFDAIAKQTEFKIQEGYQGSLLVFSKEEKA